MADQFIPKDVQRLREGDIVPVNGLVTKVEGDTALVMIGPHVIGVNKHDLRFVSEQKFRLSDWVITREDPAGHPLKVYQIIEFWPKVDEPSHAIIERALKNDFDEIKRITKMSRIDNLIRVEKPDIWPAVP